MHWPSKLRPSVISDFSSSSSESGGQRAASGSLNAQRALTIEQSLQFRGESCTTHRGQLLGIEVRKPDPRGLVQQFRVIGVFGLRARSNAERFHAVGHRVFPRREKLGLLVVVQRFLATNDDDEPRIIAPGRIHEALNETIGDRIDVREQDRADDPIGSQSLRRLGGRTAK